MAVFCTAWVHAPFMEPLISSCRFKQVLETALELVQQKPACECIGASCMGAADIAPPPPPPPPPAGAQTSGTGDLVQGGSCCAADLSRVGLSMLNSMLGPTYPQISCASLLVPTSGPLEGLLPFNCALITPGFASQCLSYATAADSEAAAALQPVEL